jgi:hypothetical protein
MIASIVVAVLAIPVLAVVSIVMAMGTRERIKRLEFRIAGLEARLAGAGGEAALSQPVPSAPPEPTPDIAMAKAEVPAEPVASLPAPAASKPKVSLEERFGTQWVVWAGGIALALGGYLLRRGADYVPARVVDDAAILFTVLRSCSRSAISSPAITISAAAVWRRWGSPSRSCSPR